MVGLGWNVRATDGADYDLDASVFLVDENNRVRGDSDFIFYNNKTSSDGSVEKAAHLIVQPRSRMLFIHNLQQHEQSHRWDESLETNAVPQGGVYA